jgi:energy-coupling factor transporter ATP-binding protein EcfA2
MTTLEDAIKKIDGETRELLGSTFQTVNEHFGRMFPELFGGGNARLVMTGEEILDSGVQVMAQPPGKKNQTIHLLSGGEKALTAIALVFAIFQLNPAPFCLLDEVDAPLDDANTERYAKLVSSMSKGTQFLFISHNKIAMEMAEQLIGVTMQEQGVSRIVAVDMESAVSMAEARMSKSEARPMSTRRPRHHRRAGAGRWSAWNAWTTRRNTPRQPDAEPPRRPPPAADGAAERTSRSFDDAPPGAAAAAGAQARARRADRRAGAHRGRRRRCPARPRWPRCRPRAAPAASRSPSKAATRPRRNGRRRAPASATARSRPACSWPTATAR